MKKKTLLITALLCILTATIFTSCDIILDEILDILGFSSSPQPTRQTAPAAPPAAPAAHFHYDLNSEGTGIIISRYVGNNPNLVIPGAIEGYPVIQVGSSGRIARDINLNSVVIPEGVRIIGRSAFYEQGNLTRVTFPSTLREIGDSAFSMTSLQTVRLPDSLEVIGGSAFSAGAFITNPNLTQINIPASIRYIGTNAFISQSLLSNLIIPDSITSITWETSEGMWGPVSGQFAECGALPLATRQRLRDLGYPGNF